jgi:hypothetical protein
MHIRDQKASREREIDVSSDRHATDRAAEARAGGPGVGGCRAGTDGRQVRRDVHPDELHVPAVQHEGQDKIRPYYDLVANIAAEEMGHIELVANTINLLAKRL